MQTGNTAIETGKSSGAVEYINTKSKRDAIIDYLKEVSKEVIVLNADQADKIIEIVTANEFNCTAKLYKYSWQLGKWDFIRDEQVTELQITKAKQQAGFGRTPEKHYKFECYKNIQPIATIYTLNPGLFY